MEVSSFLIFDNYASFLITTLLITTQESMQAIIAIKAHRARCLKIITLARKSLEEETDKLVETFTKMSAVRVHSTTKPPAEEIIEEQTTLPSSPGQPFTPSPGAQELGCKNPADLYITFLMPTN
jgi:hypothetical protein